MKRMEKKWGLVIAFALIINLFLPGRVYGEGNSQVLKQKIYSSYLERYWPYKVYLPASYGLNKKERYPVLFLLHGLYGDDKSLLNQVAAKEQLDRLSEEIGQDSIVVFVNGYDSFYLNQPLGYQMETALMKELLPQIEKDYRIDPRVTMHGLGGYSMGGYGSARLVLRYPDYFQKALLISPAVWDDQASKSQIGKNFRVISRDYLKLSKLAYESYLPTVDMDKDPLHRASFYIESGDKDPIIPIQDVEDYALALERTGYDVTFLQEAEAKHNWTYWRKAFPRAFRWFLERIKEDKDSCLEVATRTPLKSIK
ncbi:esterase [Atopobacter sp. AH10]|uniref:alpha/beta hydrolase n=1 Tax=Atopobacter sp. AH10 TaxID=2315861 RepID=UPI000EF24090|nr:alpha/beta hydrolase-fold protein [Atopobacter sp. AH10]RLK64236.1 esterase [Atopobacter sp. AH10]